MTGPTAQNRRDSDARPRTRPATPAISAKWLLCHRYIEDADLAQLASIIGHAEKRRAILSDASVESQDGLDRDEPKVP